MPFLLWNIYRRPITAITGNATIGNSGIGLGVVSTVKVALAGALLEPRVVFKAPLGSVLWWRPTLVAVTFTSTVHVPSMPPLLAGIVPVDNVTIVSPDEAVNVPPQVVLAAGVGAISTPLGRLSMSGELKVATLALGLDSVIVRVDTPPVLMVAGLKLFPSVVASAEVDTPHEEAVIVLVSIVTAPLRARARPFKFAPVFRVMLVSASMFPTKFVVVPRVAELPTCQNTLQS